MARDYAQRGGGKRRPQTQRKGGLPAWIWLVFGLSVGLAVAALVYISRPAGPMPGAVEETPPEPLAEKTENKPADKPKTPTKPAAKPAGKKDRLPLPPEEEERFTFYKDLKKQRVPLIPRDERPAKPVPKPVVAKPAEDVFLIQIASYRAVSDAENQRANLALLGIEARIEKVTVDDKDVYFRVRSGPVNREKAQALVSRLHDNGMEAILLKAN